MSALDIALTVIFSYFFIRGIFRGLVKEVVGILGLFVAFWAASVYWQAGADQLSPLTDNSTYRGVISFVVIYLVIYFLIGLLSLFVDKIVKMTITPFMSGLLGAFLGLLKGAVLVVILLTASTAFIRADQPFYTDSAAWPVFSPFCDRVQDWIPETLRKLMTNRTPALVRDLRNDHPPVSTIPVQGVVGNLPIPADYKSLMNIYNEHFQQISPAWREKLRSFKGPEDLDPEDLKRFIIEHHQLFSGVNNQNRPIASDQAATPSWPKPAGE